MDMRNSGNKEIQFAKTLLSALAKARGLQSIANTGTALIGNPVVISDKSWSCLAMAPDTDVPDLAWREFRNDGVLSITTVSQDIQSGLSKKLTESEQPFIWEAAADNCRRIFTSVIVGGRNTATVSVLEHNRPFEHSDMDYIVMLRDAVSAEMQKDKFFNYTRGMLHEELIEALLEGKTGSSLLLSDRVKAISPAMRKNIFVYVLDVRGFDMENHSVPYIRNYLEKLVTGSNALIYNDNIVLVASYDDDPYTASGYADESQLAQFLKKHNIRAGISRSFSDLNELRSHYNEAYEALGLGVHMDPGKAMYLYEDYAIYHIAKVCAEHGGTAVYIHPMLTKLLEYDNTHDSSFTESLYAYLKCGRNITDTASALHIHRNTLIYHLKRIEDLLGLSLDDCDLLLHFEMSFRMMEYDKTIARRNFKRKGADDDAQC